MTQLPNADRFSDDRTDSPYWNESVWFSFSRPEEKIHGAIQYYFRPNMGMLNGGPMIWDPSGLSQYNCLYYNWSHLQHLPEGAQKFDMTARNSLSVKVLEPLTRYSITYDKDGVVIDLVWAANAPMHELHTSDAGQRKTAAFHFEQAGRMKGMVTIDGREIPIDCCSMRDASSGPREYESLASGGYFWGIAAHSSFHAIAMGTGLNGEPQKVIGGYIWQDGALSSLVSGERRILEWGPTNPRRVVLEATDKLGRTMTARGTIEDGLIWTGYTDHTVLWSQVMWDWDGVAHLGDNQEFTGLTRFRDIARGKIKLEA